MRRMGTSADAVGPRRLTDASLSRAPAARLMRAPSLNKGTKHMRIISDIIDALAAAAFVAGVICIAIALNP